MQELLQELDPDFYREARLHIARVELKQLRRERSAVADIERRAKIPLSRYSGAQSIIDPRRVVKEA
jgi:DNA replication initiation complex subunit (GINS family)